MTKDKKNPFQSNLLQPNLLRNVRKLFLDTLKSGITREVSHMLEILGLGDFKFKMTMLHGQMTLRVTNRFVMIQKSYQITKNVLNKGKVETSPVSNSK